MAAYCVLQSIDYQVEECPMAAGNKHLTYKAALNAIERESPGAKSAFYLNFVEKMAPLLAGTTQAAAGELRPCTECGAPTTGDLCAFCALRQRVAGRPLVSVDVVLGRTRRHGRRHGAPA